MKLAKPPKAYVIGFWLSMPFITLALCFILYHERLFREWQVAVVAFRLFTSLDIFPGVPMYNTMPICAKHFLLLEQPNKECCISWRLTC